MSVRKLIFWLHLVAGVLAGVIIFVMSLTGALLSYERQLTALADGVKVTPTEAGAPRLSVANLLVKVREAHSNAIPSAIVLRSDPTAPATFTFGREKTVFANPYTGELLGEGARKTRAFFTEVISYHRWLGAEDSGKALGKAISGAANLVFFFLVLSGVILWWPRKWSVPSLKSITLFKRGLQGKARDWSWHNVFGFWAALPLLFITLTGVIISYTWAGDLVYRLTGSTPPPQAGRGDGKSQEKKGSGPDSGANKGERATKGPVELNWTHFDGMWSQAQSQVADWNMITLRMPSSAEAPFVFTIDRGTGARPDLRSQLSLDGATGQVIKSEPYSSQNLGRKVRLWVRWIHTGEAGGFVGQAIAGLASVSAMFLVWTGMMLAWRRFIGRKNKGSEMRTSQSSIATKEVSL